MSRRLLCNWKSRAIKKYLTINLGSGLSCSSALLASTMLSIAMFESEAARMEPLSLDCFDHALRSGQLDRKYDFRAVQRSALCGSRRELSNAYLLAKFGFDAGENEPSKVCPVSATRSNAERELSGGDLRMRTATVVFPVPGGPCTYTVANSLIH